MFIIVPWSLSHLPCELTYVSCYTFLETSHRTVLQTRRHIPVPPIYSKSHYITETASAQRSWPVKQHKGCPCAIDLYRYWLSYTTSNCKAAAINADPNNTRGATVNCGAPFFLLLGLLPLLPLLVEAKSGSGHTGATSRLPNVLAIHSTTPFVHPKPAWTVYSPPRPALSTSRIENFSNICKKKEDTSEIDERWVRGKANARFRYCRCFD